MNVIEKGAAEVNWYAMSGDDVVARVGVDAERGLDDVEEQWRPAEFGRNEIASEPPPTLWQVAKDQLINPMNIMLLIAASPASPSGRCRPASSRRRWCRST